MPREKFSCITKLFWNNVNFVKKKNIEETVSYVHEEIIFKDYKVSFFLARFSRSQHSGTGWFQAAKRLKVCILLFEVPKYFSILIARIQNINLCYIHILLILKID